MKYSDEEIRYICDKSFFHFCRYFCDYAIFKHKNKPLASTIIHKPVCDLWQDRTIKRKATYDPRNWRKSSYYTQMSIMWEYLQNNEITILIASQKEGRASEWLEWIEEQFLSNEELRRIYPELQAVDAKWKNSNPFSSTRCRLPRKGSYTHPTISVIGITGGAQGGHYDIIYCDDLISEKGMESPTIMEDAMRWFDNVEELLWERNVNLSDGGEIRVIGTFWAIGDLGHYIQRQYPEYLWNIVPCLKDNRLKDTKNIKWIQNPSVEQGESNWPEAYTTEGFIQMRNNPQKAMVFWCQHMNNPTGGGDAGLNKFDPDWIKWFKWETIDGDLYLRCQDDKELFKLSEIPQYGILDMGGFKEIKLIKKGSVNIQMIGGQPRGSIKKFITSFWAGKLREPSSFVDRLIEAHEAMWPHHWDIEPYGQHEFIRKYLVEETKKRGKGIRIWAINLKQADVSLGAKHNRITNMIPMVSNGELYLHESYKHLKVEMTDYPNSLTIDGLDALGWLRQLHWSHKARGNVNATNAELEQQRLSALGNSRTGY